MREKKREKGREAEHRRAMKTKRERGRERER